MDEFGKILLEALDETFVQLSFSVRPAVYWHLENRYGIKRTDIPVKFEEFVRAMRSIFSEGADVILKLAMRKLYEMLELQFEERAEWSIMNYVEQARRNFRPRQPGRANPPSRFTDLRTLFLSLHRTDPFSVWP